MFIAYKYIYNIQLLLHLYYLNFKPIIIKFLRFLYLNKLLIIIIQL